MKILRNVIEGFHGFMPFLALTLLEKTVRIKGRKSFKNALVNKKVWYYLVLLVLI